MEDKVADASQIQPGKTTLPLLLDMAGGTIYLRCVNGTGLMALANFKTGDIYRTSIGVDPGDGMIRSPEITVGWKIPEDALKDMNSDRLAQSALLLNMGAMDPLMDPKATPSNLLYSAQTTYLGGQVDRGASLMELMILLASTITMQRQGLASLLEVREAAEQMLSFVSAMPEDLQMLPMTSAEESDTHRVDQPSRRVSNLILPPERKH